MKTPLTYADTVDLVLVAAPDIDVKSLARLITLVMDVDQASRTQEREKPVHDEATCHVCMSTKQIREMERPFNFEEEAQ